MALSMDLREKVMKAIRGGMSRRQAAARFDIGPATAVRWANRIEITGEVAPAKRGGDRRSQRIEAHADFILAQIKDKPDNDDHGAARLDQEAPRARRRLWDRVAFPRAPWDHAE
jgi:transposase